MDLAILDNREFGEWLEDEYKSRGLEQQDLADLIGIGRSAVSNWVTGRAIPPARRCDQIAIALNIDPNEVRRRAGKKLLRETPSTYQHGTIPTSGNVRPGVQAAMFVPIIGLAPADASRWVTPLDQYEIVEPQSIAGIGDPAFVVVTGDCLSGRGIHNGDKVLIDRQAEPAAGNIVVIRIGDEITMKEFWPENDHVILRAAAPGYPPIRIESDDENIEIIGVARRILSWRDV